MSQFLLILSFIFGLLFFYRGFRIFSDGKNSLTWKPISAYVISTRLEKIDRYGLIGRFIFQTYLPVISYNYSVGDIEYQSEEYSPDGDKKFDSYFGVPGSSKAEAFLEMYPDNSKITIYYNPVQPDKAVIERGVSKWSYIPLFIIGALLVLIPVIL